MARKVRLFEPYEGKFDCPMIKGSLPSFGGEYQKGDFISDISLEPRCLLSPICRCSEEHNACSQPFRVLDHLGLICENQEKGILTCISFSYNHDYKFTGTAVYRHHCKTDELELIESAELLIDEISGDYERWKEEH